MSFLRSNETPKRANMRWFTMNTMFFFFFFLSVSVTRSNRHRSRWCLQRKPSPCRTTSRSSSTSTLCGFARTVTGPAGIASKLSPASSERWPACKVSEGGEKEGGWRGAPFDAGRRCGQVIRPRVHPDRQCPSDVSHNGEFEIFRRAQAG